jgi:hypothetical protein
MSTSKNRVRPASLKSPTIERITKLNSKINLEKCKYSSQDLNSSEHVSPKDLTSLAIYILKAVVVFPPSSFYFSLLSRGREISVEAKSRCAPFLDKTIAPIKIDKISLEHKWTTWSSETPYSLVLLHKRTLKAIQNHQPYSVI